MHIRPSMFVTQLTRMPGACAQFSSMANNIYRNDRLQPDETHSTSPHMFDGLVYKLIHKHMMSNHPHHLVRTLLSSAKHTTSYFFSLHQLDQ